MSFSHAGIAAQQLQRVIRGVEQLRGTCASHQVDRCRGRDLLERRFGRALHRRHAPRLGNAREHARASAAGHPGPQSIGPFSGVLGGRADAASSPSNAARPAVSSGSGRSWSARGASVADLSALASAGLGSLYSWTVVWRPPYPAFVGALRSCGGGARRRVLHDQRGGRMRARGPRRRACGCRSSSTTRPTRSPLLTSPRHRAAERDGRRHPTGS